MTLTRRGFLKLSAVSVTALGFDLEPARGDAREYRTVCPYCAVGCGTIAYVHG